MFVCLSQQTVSCWKCQIRMSLLLVLRIDLERGNVVVAMLGDSSGSVWSEEYSEGPSSTTRVGIAPLPCSMDTTFSWEQFLQREQQSEREREKCK